MPYTQSQLRCLNGMGIVPWVERAPWVERSTDQTDAATALCDTLVEAEKSVVQNHVLSQSASQSKSESCSNPADFMQTPLIEIPFRGKRCTQLGKTDALLLILVEANSTHQNQYPFEPADAKIFDDMLRSISWRRQDVCLGVLPPLSEPALLVDKNAPSVSDLCKPHRDAVLLFRQSLPETNNVEELIVPLARKGMLAWQLPHPALLRESPERKRQAWNVLKAARTRLG